MSSTSSLPQNPKVANLTSQLLASSSTTSRSDPDPDTLDEDDLFAELEAEIENDDGPLREQGLKELQREMERLKQMREEMHGKYTELTDEKQIIRTCASEPLCIIHFYHSNFSRCAIMDKHMAALAPKYFNTRFLRVFVENVPFLVEKLGLKVLPCVISFIKGVSKDRIIGFEELGNVDNFGTATLELRLLHTGVIQKDPHVVPVANSVRTVATHGTRVRQNHRDDDDDDFDL